MTVRFDDAWSAAHRLAQQISDDGGDVILVRDLFGRVSVILDDRDGKVDERMVDATRVTLSEQSGRFVGAQAVLRATELFEPSLVLDADELVTVPGQPGAPGRVRVLERGAVGAEWSRVREMPPGRRVTFYGFKGGVGRSTAAFMFAASAAQRGLSVLVVDLDLESPGVGDLLLAPGELPEHGLLDHLAEHALGQAEGLEMVARSPHMQTSGNGEVWAAPVRGEARRGYDYLPKLNRAYLDVPAIDGRPPLSFARRLEDAVSACEAEVTRRSRPPDVVVLDSRAGLHDVAAVALSQLSDTNLLFAANNVQTWAGYAELFLQWRGAGRASDIRERLKMVAPMAPAVDLDSYLVSYRDQAQACFAETLYDDEDGVEVDTFNPSPNDVDAPHSPLPIQFVGELVGLDARMRRDWYESDMVANAYHLFSTPALDLVLGDR